MSVLTRIFRTFSDADAARDALIAAGFDKGRVSLSARHDEAGPVQGNFAIGNGIEEPSGPASIPAAGGESNNVYQRNFGNPEGQGMFVLMVECDAGAGDQAASEILSRSGAVDIDDLTGARGNSG